jgi:hypothetical protein
MDWPPIMTKYEKKCSYSQIYPTIPNCSVDSVSFLKPLHLCQLLTLTLVQLHTKHKDPIEEDTSDAHEKI